MGFRDRYKKPEETKDPIVETIKEVLPKAEIIVIEPEKKPVSKKIVEPEEIQKKIKKEKRRRGVNKTKPFVNVSIMGDTVEVRDFRAICKKNGWQMNNTLTKILHEWNTANYNL